MLKWLKINPKFFLYTLLTLTCLFTVSVLAQANLLKDKQNAISQGGNQEAWLSEAFSSNAVAGLQALVGPIPDDVIDGKVTSWIPGGAFGTVNQAVAMTFTPAASGVEYIAQTWHSFLGQPAYAANTGFDGLQPLLPIWRGFRNVVYILASLVFIVIGIMIMLRVKISPQAVITVQNAIPQLITTLILVTFSYAIAGLLIDFTYLLQNSVIAILFNAASKPFTGNLLSNDLTNLLGVPTNLSSLSNFDFGTTFFLVTKHLGLIPLLAVGALIGGIIGGILGSAIPAIGTLVVGVTGAGLGAILFALIIVVIIFINLIKFLIGLIKCYLSVLFNIILAPLQIGLGAFPGSKSGFGTWFVELFANLSVFPISLIFLVLVNVIIESINGNIWVPNIIGLAGLTGTPFFISFIIALGALFILPKLPELIPQAIFALKPSAWQQAVTQSAKEIGAMPVGAINTIHMVSGIGRDWRDIGFVKKDKKPTITPQTQPARATNQRHEQSDAENENDIPMGPLV